MILYTILYTTLTANPWCISTSFNSLAEKAFNRCTGQRGCEDFS